MLIDFSREHFGQQAPPGEGKKESFQRSKEEIELNMKNEILKSSLFLHDLAYFSLFFCYLGSFQSMLGQNIQNFQHFTPSEVGFLFIFRCQTREEIFIQGKGRNKGFWPKYLPLLVGTLLLLNNRTGNSFFSKKRPDKKGMF